MGKKLFPEHCKILLPYANFFKNAHNYSYTEWSFTSVLAIILCFSVLCMPQASLHTDYYAIIKKHTLRLPCKPGNLCPLVIHPLKDSYTS